ncbi:MAG TPA: cytochrome c oxidase accessory protein CcoG [Rhodocyclaceae bacterium]|nr:cytochrome c oxidase accessory protein CcoG [Rhodocyclaceae bacterium]
MNDPASIPTSTEAPVSLYVKAKKIHNRSVHGLFSKWRWALVWLTQAIFYGLCWVPWNGRQALLFDLVERKFYIFGMVFWPQDVFYLAVLLIISAYGLFLFTAVGGRLFCGYACPQTVYTEIFMWIEQKIEGDRNARIKLDQQPMNGAKFAKRFAKHAAWIAVALWTGFTFAGYFTPVHTLGKDLIAWTLGPWQTFWIFFYAFATYGMAGFMREQVCKYMCPYARFQSVMFDPDTLIVTYDTARGEPRGARAKKEDYKAAGKGDCVDCGICVQVCPTGIDIRNGLQYECIGCSACIDGCDEVMDKVGYPRGLIRYSTERAMENNWTRDQIYRHVFRPRILLYTAILIAITVAAAWAIAVRLPVKMDVIRDRGVMAREVDDGVIENVYTLRVMNTDESAHTYRLSVAGLPTLSVAGATEISVPAASTQSVTVALHAEPESGKKGSQTIYFDLADTANAKVALHEKAIFYLP